MTASLRILTVFPFHSPAGKHLYATNTLQYFVSRCPHCSNDCRACQPGESALEVLPYHCLSDHRTGCGTARCTPSKRESIQNDRKVVSPLVAAHLLLLCPPYHMNSDRPIQRACRFILFRATVPAGNCQYSPWPAPLSEPETFEKHATCHSTLTAGSEPWPSASAPAAAGNLRTRFHCSPPELK